MALLLVAAVAPAAIAQEVDNWLCPGSTGAPGALAPLNVTEIPADVVDAAVEAALSANWTTPAGTFDWTGCDDFTYGPVLACSQIVAGANYRILLDFYCPDNGAWSNGLNTVGFVVNVTVPAEAPDTPEVTGITLQGGAPPAVLPPAPTNTLCPGPSMPGGYLDCTDVPEELPMLVAEAFLDSNETFSGEPFTGCANFTAKLSQACCQAVAGINYLVEVNVYCQDGGTWDNGLSVAGVNATVFYPLPNTNEPPEVTSVQFIAGLPPPVVMPMASPSPSA